MAYNYLTDFVGLWRAVSGGVEKGEMPGLDFVIAALGRAGILNLIISGSPPIVNQETTAWFKPSVSPPDYAAEGTLYLWNGTTYVQATTQLFITYLMNSIGDNGLAIWLVTGAPSNLVGANGDLAIRQDAPGGIYGPKVGGSWPADPLPGTSYSQISDFLDFLGTAQGDIVYRNASAWVVLSPGTAGQVLVTGGAGANPAWASTSTIVAAGLDLIGNTQGDILYRNATQWTVLHAGTAGDILTTGGAGANPAWASSSAFTLTSAAVDAAFGATAGGVLVRGSSWTNSGAGSAGQVLTSNGAAAPTFQTLAIASTTLDALFGATQGSIIYRSASAWTTLGPGVNGQFLMTAGAAANPSWQTVTAGLGPGAVGSVAIGDGGATVYDGSGSPYPGTWVRQSTMSIVADVGGVPTNIPIFLMQRTA